ncbi:DUF721 domain-containing protein [Desulfoferrobacter suflitae]|uniref:DUF721 domain-containing protein n=1 Tax=Desulfoferrobacter suflitae TaxID=2865782 RepID=UPI00216450DB|nr:DUF721 domain-containing protein [Desulfoferrobacter suflitae]MCK8603997.1 DUF721 domain-containing protein [Desulfoferrobacter suflitae]
MKAARGGRQQIGELLCNFLQKHPAFSANPLGDWEKLVGPQLARHSQPKSLKNKVLHVHVYDSIWKHHLELNKTILLDKINHSRPEPLVEKIVIRIGEIAPDQPVLNPNHRLLGRLKKKKVPSGKKSKSPSRPLTREEKELLAGIPDVELRALGRKLLRRLSLEDDEESG